MAKAYLEITLKIDDTDRLRAAGIYNKFKDLFLETIKGALSIELLVHVEDVQVLHGFDSTKNAKEYLMSSLLNQDVFADLKPYVKKELNIKIYNVAA